MFFAQTYARILLQVPLEMSYMTLIVFQAQVKIEYKMCKLGRSRLKLNSELRSNIDHITRDTTLKQYPSFDQALKLRMVQLESTLSQVHIQALTMYKFGSKSYYGQVRVLIQKSCLNFD